MAFEEWTRSVLASTTWNDTANKKGERSNSEGLKTALLEYILACVFSLAVFFKLDHNKTNPEAAP